MILQSRGHIEAFAFGERHICFLDIREKCFAALERTNLALADESVHAVNFYVEQAFNSSFDLRLGCAACHVENNLVMHCNHSTLFSDRWALDDGVKMFFAHLKRASSASTAALVRT